MHSLAMGCPDHNRKSATMQAVASLTIVGTGLRAALDTTLESRACIERATKVLYLVADPLSATWIEALNPSAQSLAHFYELGRPRFEIYEAIIEEILDWLHKTSDLCIAFYGHPGFYAFAGHEAIKRAKLEGFRARMLAGVSCQDQMFADLSIDPGASGCQTYEATSFLIHRIRFERTAGLILLQVGVLGQASWPPSEDNPRLPVLVEYLVHSYGPDHGIIVYAASTDPEQQPKIQHAPLSRLGDLPISVSSTLYIPPAGFPVLNLDMIERLKMKAPSKPDDPGAWARQTADASEKPK
jgi:uncharacterized protein YabN with tetrapyrrole methylase and pyrophosphatase domain